MSFDQTLRILDTLGIWVSGIGTFAAAGIALWLALRREKVKLEARVGLRLSMGGGVSEECLVFYVTNLGDRSVTVNNIGWCIGKKRNRKYSIQLLTHSSPDQIPKKIEYGENAMFMVNFSESPDWTTNFVNKFILDESVETLRGQIFTSVGYTKVIKPDKELLVQLQAAQVNLHKSVEKNS